ncbi:hypothetical protein ACGFYV_05280 [Streptomyces sp. NPDC048297]|uniref:hypothetical protein n=1 Tax=Streptomyces sp. NPDC048297 TaxID=3365531 RepID=UPI0037187D4D
MSQVDEEERRVQPADKAAAVRPGGRAGLLRHVAERAHLLPTFVVLTVMMLALWLLGMPFMQALTISTAVKIALVLLDVRRGPRSSGS